MKTFRNFARRCAIRKISLAMGLWIVLLSCLSAGCGRRVSYVSGERTLIRLEAGQSAPRAGVLMSEAYLSEIYEALKQ